MYQPQISGSGKWTRTKHHVDSKIKESYTLKKVIQPSLCKCSNSLINKFDIQLKKRFLKSKSHARVASVLVLVQNCRPSTEGSINCLDNFDQISFHGLLVDYLP